MSTSVISNVVFSGQRVIGIDRDGAIGDSGHDNDEVAAIGALERSSPRLADSFGSS